MKLIDLADYWLQTPTTYLSLYRKQMLEGDPPAIEMMGIENNPDSWRVEDGFPSEMYAYAAICPACGWWSIIKQVTLDTPKQFWDLIFRAEGALRSLDIDDVSQPISDIRAFLMAKYGQRFEVHPRKFEEVVASVFGNLGYQAAVTAYSCDGGIDAVLHGPRGELIGVQVKRYKNSIEVEQIRSFVGALLLGGFAKGIFVTTSRYQSGVPALTQQSRALGISIELIDEQVLFEALRVAPRCHRLF